MKNGLLIMLVLATAVTASAQKVIEKHMPLSSNGFVSMNFQISDSIRIVMWDKNEVYVKSTIDVNDNQNNDDYKETFDESATSVNVTGKLHTNCNNYHRRKRAADSTHRSDDDDNCCSCNCGCETNIVHEVHIPENTDFSVETINGNIIISGNTAGVRAKSISGYIDLTMAPQKPAALRMQTITGTMYSNFDLGGTNGLHRQVGGRTVDAQLNGTGGKAVDLETISGDIFFRKLGT
jgi:hypothetical protein